MSITDRIKSLRTEKKISQAELAKKLNISAGNVGDWERGRSKPGADAIVALMDFFGVTSDYLLTGKEDQPIYKPSIIEPFLKEDEFSYNSSKLKFSEDEINMILRHREGELIIVDKIHCKIHGDIKELNERETDIILKFREIEDHEKEDVYDNLCWRYERMIQKKISSGSKTG